MPYSFVAAGPGSVAGTQFSKTISATFAAGETVLVVAGSWGFGASTNPTCSDGVNTYTRVALFGTTGWIAIWKADNVAAGTVTITVTDGGAGQVGGLNFFRFTGLAAGAVQAAAGRSYNPNGAGGADNVIGLPVTPTGQPAMLFAATWVQNPGVPERIVAGTGYTSRGQLTDEPRGRAQDARLTSLVAVTPVFTTTAPFEEFQIAAIVVAETPDAPPQALVPSADVSNGAWLASSGADLFAMIDEAVSNAGDFIFTASPGAECVVALAAGSDPGVSTGHTVRYRAQGDGLSGLTVALLQGTTVIASWTTNPLPAVETLYEHTLTGPQADAITNYAQLRLRFTEV